MPFAHPNEQMQIILRGVVDLVEREELQAKLTRSADRGKPLTVMAGFDPSSANLHLGHTVLLRKMRQFQDLGHEVIFLIGDFTAQVGDPSGQQVPRPRLEEAAVVANARTYAEQAGHILDPGRTRIEYNRSWLAGMALDRLLALATHLPLPRLLERPDLQDRHDLMLHELLYPLLQAYDSVHLGVDVEIGGQDQVPNLMLGRTLMASLGMEPQCILATELLEGTDATCSEGEIIGRKMSNSCANTVDITEPEDEIRRKIRRLDDGLVWRYFELLTDCSVPQIRAYRNDVDAGKREMLAVKDTLADEIIRMLGG